MSDSLLPNLLSKTALIEFSGWIEPVFSTYIHIFLDYARKNKKKVLPLQLKYTALMT